MHLSPEKQRLAVVGLLLLWCIALNFFGFYLAPASLGLGLLWNLFLAAVPVVWSAAFQSACSKEQNFKAFAFFVLWLLFFPNAPYLLTDLVHLRPTVGIPSWYLLAMLLSYAGAGTMLGYLSLIHVHNAIQQRLGELTGWMVAISSLLLCGFGIYVGRFLRWNSWNAFNDPLNLLKDVAGRMSNPGEHPHPLAVTLVYATGLIIGYLSLRIFAASASSRR